jgi:hypothetical protein
MGIAEPVIGRAFARPVGSTHPTTDAHSRSRGASHPKFFISFALLENRATVLEVDRRTAGLKAGAERATAFGG